MESDKRSQPGSSDGGVQVAILLEHRLANLERLVAQIHDAVMDARTEKEWYTTSELAEALGKSQYTIQERWCNEGRIDCEKDAANGKWRIPGHEFRRLVNGGTPKPKRKAT